MFKTLVVSLFCAACLHAQIAPPLSCVANSGTTPLLRAEGLAELGGDIVISCTGGTPTPAGVTVPSVDLGIYLNTSATSARVVAAGSMSEAFLLIDDARPDKRKLCASGADCSVPGGSDFTAGTVPNLFYGSVLDTNLIVFRYVPVDPPGANKMRTLRITNLRANVHQIGSASLAVPLQLKAALSPTSPVVLPVSNPEVSIGYSAAGLAFSLRTAADDAVLPVSGRTLSQCTPNNGTASTLTDGTTFVARFTEGFASSFRRRNIALASNADQFPAPVAQDGAGGVCSSGSVPLSQTACPANNYFTESGLYMPSLPATHGFNTAGLANQGTRLLLRFSGVPSGVNAVVGLYEFGKTAANSRVRLVSADGVPVAAAGTTPYAFAPVAIAQGAGSVVYEVINSDPLSTESIDVPVAISYGAGAGVGLITVTGSFAPIADDSSVAPSPRFADVPVSRTAVMISSCSSCATISPTSRVHGVGVESGTVQVTAAQNCSWSSGSDSSWLAISGGASGTGNGTVSYSVGANASGPRAGNLVIGNQIFSVAQAGQPSCGYSLTSILYPAPVTTAFGSVNVSSNCTWTATSNANWVIITSGTSGSGNGSVSFSIQGNTGPARQAAITVGTAIMQVTQPAGSGSTGGGGGGLRFVPVTPCRVVDTRANQGTTGAFGPPTMNGGTSRSFPLPQGRCNLPSTAQAYSVNVTVVPAAGALAYLTLWPTGQAQPFVSTLNSFAGDVLANAAIVPAGTGGAVSVYVSDKADVVIDVNGYFASPDAIPAGSAGLSLFPVTPCRVVDTRAGQGTFGDFGPPTMAAASKRDIPIPLGACGIPSYAKAYAVNVTVVPAGGPLAFLTAWPAGLPQPGVSTLNSIRGKILANAAILPAGLNGAVSVYVYNATDLVIDINGYFAEGA